MDDIPQATSAHDTFWDYVANNQESANFIMWLMSGRGRPRSYRMMDGYPVNTFRFINAEGKSTFVRFHFKAALGHHSLLLDEAAIIGGVDPDYHRRDIKEAIEQGAYPEYEFGVQLIPEEDEFKYDFDVLDATKFWPEEVVPLEIIGKMTFNRTMDNEFAENEQSAFDPSNVVPGIAFSNDPVLQGRSFAYRDTHYHRLGTANVEEIPINQPIHTPHVNMRNGYARHRIDVDKVHYGNNSLADNTPAVSDLQKDGFVNYSGQVQGQVTREPSESFNDHFSQARLFWNSMSPREKKDIVDSFNYHVGFVESKSVRQQVVDMFAKVDIEMATKIADNVGVNPPDASHVAVTASSPAVSEAMTRYSAYSQKVGILIGNDFNSQEVQKLIDTLKENGVFYEIISERLGVVTGNDTIEIPVDKTFIVATSSTLYDSLYVVGGNALDQTRFDLDIMNFVNTAYKHYKAIGVASTGKFYIQKPDGNLSGVIFAENSPNFEDEFIAAVAQKRFWDRT